MALFRTLGRIAQVSGQHARICAFMSRRGYADGGVEMSFTFATPSESFYSDAKIKQVRRVPKKIMCKVLLIDVTHKRRTYLEMYMKWCR